MVMISAVPRVFGAVSPSIAMHRTIASWPVKVRQPNYWDFASLNESPILDSTLFGIRIAC